MPRRIAIATIGTHGDVQPFVALALTLKKRGFSPVIGTTDDFGDYVRSHDIEYFSLGGDVQAFLRQAAFENAMTKSRVLYAPGLMRKGASVLKAAANNAWRMAQDVDAIVFQNNTTFCIDIAEARGIPSIMAAFQPLAPTMEFPYFQYGLAPLDPLLYRFSRQPFSKSPRIDPVINKLTYMVQVVQQQYWELPRYPLRRKVLGLKRMKKNGFYTNGRGEPLPTLHAYSSMISPAPGDWPENNIITGFWRLDDPTEWVPSPDFQAFLDAGPPPIYIGFGSMPWGASRNGEAIAKALSLWGGRAVIAKGWGGVRSDLHTENVFFLDRAPHDKLFPLMKAVVHHGGAGTTYAGLYAGKPSFAVPQFYDQPYWGRQIYELGVGPLPVNIRKLTPQLLANALDDLDATPAYAQAAAALGERLRLEDGTNRAVDAIEEILLEHGGLANRDYQLMGTAS